MKIYFAGEPGGNIKIREREIIELGICYRLKSYHYIDQLLNTLKVMDERIFHTTEGKENTTR